MAAQNMLTNQPPAQTWNHLSINGACVTLPGYAKTSSEDAQKYRDPSWKTIEVGTDEKLCSWLDICATQRQNVEIKAYATQTINVNITENTPVAQTYVHAHEASNVTINICAATENECQVPAEKGAARAFLGEILRVQADHGAHVRINLLIALHDSYQFVDACGILADESAKVEVKQFLLSAAQTTLGTTCDLAGDMADYAIDTRYLVGTDELVDMNFITRQRGQKTHAQMDAYGILSDNAQKSLRATIDMCCGCKGAKGAEQESVILAGKDIVNKTLPVILCDEEDVEGDHGATIGSVAQNQFDYLHSRGLSEENINALFSRAVLDVAVTQLPDHMAQAALSWTEKHFDNDTAQDIAQEHDICA